MPGRRYNRSSNTRTLNSFFLIDYANLYNVLASSPSTAENPDEAAILLIDRLQQHMSDHLNVNVLRTMLFTDVTSGAPVDVVNIDNWVSRGIDTRLVSGNYGDDSCSQMLIIEACKLLYTGPEIDSLVILSGNAWFKELIQEYQGHGRFVLAACLEIPEISAAVPDSVRDVYFNAGYLIAHRDTSQRSSALHPGSDLSSDSDESTKAQPEETFPVEDEMALRGLEIIETEFGQYEEIYLTPLLRRLTEQLDGEDEPKSVISLLEECGAVWLEKRRGFPHNYTVLMMNSEHPDVVELRREFQDDEGDTFLDDQSPARQEEYDSGSVVFQNTNE